MPSLPIHQRTPTRVSIGDQSLTVFGGCDYLALSRAPSVLEAIRDGLDRYGVSVTASRETTGNTAAHEELEHLAAAFFERELPDAHALLCPDGYTANLAATQTLAALGVRRAVIDARAHQSLYDAANAARMRITRYDHANPRSAADACGPAPCVVLTDGVFSAHGDPAPVRALAEATPGHATLLIDDCHGVAATGARGRGSLEGAAVDPSRIVLTTTLAKGVGVAGGLMLAPPKLVHAARQHATAYVCTTPIAPILAIGAAEAMRLIDREPKRLARLAAAATALRDALAARGLCPPDRPATPVATFTLADADSMRALHDDLLAAGYIAPLIEYPGGPAPLYFRLSVNANHTPADVRGLFNAIDTAANAHA